MRHHLITSILLFAILNLNACSKFDADLGRGLAAYQNGDYAGALKEFKPLAEEGNAQAQYHIGWMYREGQGVPQDEVQMAQWIRKSADQGHAEAQHYLGELYAHGIGVRENHAQAAHWFLKAAEQGDSRSQYNLGLLYEYGASDVQKNVVAAYALFSLSAKANSSDDNPALSALEIISKRMTSEEIDAGEAFASRIASAESVLSKELSLR